MRSPEGGDLWEFPGFYSLTIRYGNQNDYYFNTVVASCAILVLEFHAIKQHLLMVLAIVALVGNFYLSLCLKGHYLIDNFGGLMIGVYMWIVSNNWLSYFVDVKLFGLTLYERFSHIPTECKNCKNLMNDWV